MLAHMGCKQWGYFWTLEKSDFCSFPVNWPLLRDSFWEKQWWIQTQILCTLCLWPQPHKTPSGWQMWHRWWTFCARSLSCLVTRSLPLRALLHWHGGLNDGDLGALPLPYHRPSHCHRQRVRKICVWIHHCFSQKLFLKRGQISGKLQKSLFSNVQK